jgi:menaquinone-dependent protoporphyrinogen IX oxidase
MDHKSLVAYPTSYGAATEIAGATGESLVEAGHGVDV